MYIVQKKLAIDRQGDPKIYGRGRNKLMPPNAKPLVNPQVKYFQQMSDATAVATKIAAMRENVPAKSAMYLRSHCKSEAEPARWPVVRRPQFVSSPPPRRPLFMNRLFAFVIAALTCHNSRDAAAAVLGTVPSSLLLVRSLAWTEKGFQLSQEDRGTETQVKISKCPSVRVRCCRSRHESKGLMEERVSER